LSRFHKKQQRMRRDPAQITGLWSDAGVAPELLEAHADRGWKDTLWRLGVTLLVTREYEHLVLALNGKETTYLHLPHPSGLVADRRTGTVHVACTRNPNLLMELKGPNLLPARARFLPGSLYLHDLALIGGELHGNSVGRNAIVHLDYDKGARNAWWPKCIVKKNPVYHRNYIQMNSIAAGKNLRESFFSASTDRMGEKVPGDPSFPVDKRGVIFSGRTREAIAWGLTRPHSARFYRGELWVDNSGYGEVGRVLGGRFDPLVKLDGWTRGLCFVKDVLVVGVSRILPRFHAYAPGVNPRTSRCGLVAIDPKTGRILGRLTWPEGNQVFAIDWMENVRLPYGANSEPSRLFYDFEAQA
jgi:uncharacterized protein (TIGR03032 family)